MSPAGLLQKGKHLLNARSLRRFFSVELLACPRCEGEEIVAETPLQLRCTACDARYPVVDGLPLLLKDQEARTRLDPAEYNAGHKINEKSAERTWQEWERVFERYGVGGGDLLEIGCGSGLLTYGLVKHQRFESIHASDLSPEFIGATRALLADLGEGLSCYACDANHLPFRAGSVDVIVGRSVLHHFLDYPQTIRQCHRLLKPGGVAIFLEPVIQGKSLIAFLMDLMLRTDQEFQMNLFTAKQADGIRRQVKHQVTVPKIKDQRERLAGMEDKYIFDLEEFAQLAETIGFSRFGHLAANDTLPRSFKPDIVHVMGYYGISRAQVDRFDYLFESFQSTYSEVMGDRVVTPMVYLTFWR